MRVLEIRNFVRIDLVLIPRWGLVGSSSTWIPTRRQLRTGLSGTLISLAWVYRIASKNTPFREAFHLRSFRTRDVSSTSYQCLANSHTASHSLKTWFLRSLALSLVSFSLVQMTFSYLRGIFAQNGWVQNCALIDLRWFVDSADVLSFLFMSLWRGMPEIVFSTHDQHCAIRKAIWYSIYLRLFLDIVKRASSWFVLFCNTLENAWLQENKLVKVEGVIQKVRVTWFLDQISLSTVVVF